MANGTNLGVFMDLQQHPLGSQRGESFGMPQNYRIPPARIYVRNWSKTRKWKRIVIPVSARRGAQEALVADKELAKVYNVDTLIQRIKEGQNMNRYKTEVHPVVFKLRLPGGRYIAIPHAQDEHSEPPMVEVPEGTWDLYLGNYERMRGILRDPKGDIVEENSAVVIGEEKSRLALQWNQRHNPVFAYTDDGDQTEMNNEYGILEFVRVTQRAVQEPIDKDYLTAADLVEA